MSRAAALLENERFRAVSISKQALEERLRQDEKMKSLGLLAGGVAHDFNNLLAVVKGNAEMLGETMERDNPDRELVVEIDQAVQRGQDLTRQLLTFSRKQASHAVVMELGEAAAECAKLVRRIVGEHIRVVTTISEQPCYVPPPARLPRDGMRLRRGGGEGALRRHPFTTIISDVVMPGLHGAAFREAALARRPAMRFLFISGFPDDELVRHGVMRGSFELLTKAGW